MVEDVDTSQEIDQVADRLQEAFQEPLSIADEHVLVRVSIGIAVGGLLLAIVIFSRREYRDLT